MGVYNLDEYRKRRPLIDIPVPDDATKDDIDDTNETRGQLPTDTCRIEQSITITSWVNMLEDMLMSLQINVALAKGFKHLHIPKPGQPPKKKYIDLWPIQMSAQIATEDGQSSSVLTTNFDTYTLILQLGCILHTVPAWKNAYTVRVIVFVEYESDVEEECGRVKALLENLRIKAEVVVCWLAKGNLSAYETIVNGKQGTNERVESLIGNEEWWVELQRRRREAELYESQRGLNSQVADLLRSEQWPHSTFLQQGKNIPGTKVDRFLAGVKKFVKRKKGRSVTCMHGLGESLGTMNMRTHSLQPHVLSESESESSESDSDSESVASTESAASLNDADNYKDDDGDDEIPWEGGWLERHRKPDSPSRRASIGAGVRLTPAEVSRFEAKRRSSYNRKSLNIQPTKSRTELPTIPSPGLRPGSSDAQEAPTIDSSAPSASSASLTAGTVTPSRPGLKSRRSTAAFTSKTIPHAQVVEHEDSGPSIMFADQDPPSKRASGYPGGQDVSLSFNDLPGLAQYLILNELMGKYSDDTAVVFTTLPGPLAGTYKSEEACVEYIAGLDVLCEGLPPVLLIHSNSMTVTMAL
ncbi:hypothetical protein AA313_de0209573 [Arthrobotrys entomopaga]|nr:hypothetical protein AA313_de0209573 [Arthrobotrys entomopaga]